jgi:hypothetical protein
MAKARRPLYPAFVKVKVARHYWDDERDCYMAEIQWPDEVQQWLNEQHAPWRPTLKQKMILAIVRQHYPSGIPTGTSIADLDRLIARHWGAECAQRKIEPPPKTPAPQRDTIARTLRLAALIE